MTGLFLRAAEALTGFEPHQAANCAGKDCDPVVVAGLPSACAFCAGRRANGSTVPKWESRCATCARACTGHPCASIDATTAGDREGIWGAQVAEFIYQPSKTTYGGLFRLWEREGRYAISRQAPLAEISGHFDSVSRAEAFVAKLATLNPIPKTIHMSWRDKVNRVCPLGLWRTYCMKNQGIINSTEPTIANCGIGALARLNPEYEVFLHARVFVWRFGLKVCVRARVCRAWPAVSPASVCTETAFFLIALLV